MAGSGSSVLRRSSWKSYHRNTRTATYGFLLGLPLFLLYEGMILLTSARRVVDVRVGAEIWIKQLLALIGATGMQALAVVVLLVGIGVFFYERKKSIPIRPRYFAWVVLESAVYAVVVATLVSAVVGAIFMRAPALQDQGLWMEIALSIGAGLYEELLFRVLLVGGLYLLFREILRRRDWAYPTAAIIGAILFSAVHYIGPLGDAFAWPSFTFRFLFGLALNVLFLWRGFGVAAWTHALYDIFVVTSVFG